MNKQTAQQNFMTYHQHENATVVSEGLLWKALQGHGIMNTFISVAKVNCATLDRMSIPSSPCPSFPSTGLDKWSGLHSCPFRRIKC